jgi:hypothetical protein
MRVQEFTFALLLMAGCAMPAPGKDANDELLTRLADRAAIQDLMTAYATAHNTTDPELYRQIFADDVKILSADGKVRLDGMQALLAEVKNDRTRFNPGAKDGVRTYGVMRHLFTNMETNVTGNTATGHCYAIVIANNVPAKAELIAMARYDNEYVKRTASGAFPAMNALSNGHDEMAKVLQIGPYTPAEYR